ncbi:MAG TPA: thiamine phosphate synthase [Hyphomicrobiales bacterium]|nr:thiamine phosphate synthase [Hyphomicrobiales bacterium]
MAAKPGIHAIAGFDDDSGIAPASTRRSSMSLVNAKPVVYTIAGSDSSGGAGIQADLLTLHSLGVHACTLITALTTQNQQGVRMLEPREPAQLCHEFLTMKSTMPPVAIKIGMLANATLVRTVAALLQDHPVPTVCDPVLGASAGGALLDAAGRQQLRLLLPLITLLTPNAQEAALLTGMPVRNLAEMETAAEALRALGAPAVLVTGGDLDLDGGCCYDYFASATGCFWLQGPRIATPHTHGTGCTLSSAIAAFLAHGQALEDAVVLARMAVTQGLRDARGVGTVTGAVAHPGWPRGLENLPRLWPGRAEMPQKLRFAPCAPLGLYPVVDSVAWVEKLLAEGVHTIQLRIKHQASEPLRASIRQAVALQRRHGAQLFINDHWQLAIECGAYGVHLGQEDLAQADLAAIAAAGLRLGTSNHSWSELARSHALAPSYLALGPIFPTTTKVMRFAPQGLTQLCEWVALLDPHYRLTAIGGIDTRNAAQVLVTGVPSIAVVRAITEARDHRQAVRLLTAALAEAMIEKGNA